MTWGWKGKFRYALTFVAGDTQAELSAPGEATIRYNAAAVQLEMSVNGGAYTPIGGGGGGGGWVDAGAVVRLQTIGDQVAIGANLPVGAEKVRIVGDTRMDGNLAVDNVITTPAASGSDLELTSDTGKITVTMAAAGADAFLVAEGADRYIAIDTTAASEDMAFGNATTNPPMTFAGSGSKTFSGEVGLLDGPLALTELAADPGAGANTGKVYTKDVAGLSELFYRDSAGNVVQMTSGGSAAAATDVPIADNSATAYRIHQGADNYFLIDTTNGSEAISFGSLAINPAMNFLGSGLKTFGGSVTLPSGNVTLSAGSANLVELGADPGATANTGKVYTKDVAGTTELFYQDSGGAVVQITTAGGVAAATDIPIADNSATAFRVHQSADNYILVNTTNAAENVSLGNTVTNPTMSLLGTGLKTVSGSLTMPLGDLTLTSGNALLSAGSLTLTNGSATLTSGNLLMSSGSITLTLGNVVLSAGNTTYVEVGADPGATANAGKVYTKDVSALTELFYQNSAGTVVQITSGSGVVGATDITIADNSATAFRVHEAANNYILVNTTNAAENISLGNATTNPTLSVLGTGLKTFSGAVTISTGNLTVSAGQVSITGTGTVLNIALPDNTASAVLWREGAGNDYFKIDTTNNAEEIWLGDDSATSTRIHFWLRDNASDALTIYQQSANEYLSISTSNGDEYFLFGNAGTAQQYRFRGPGDMIIGYQTTDGAIRFVERAAAPATVANSGAIYTKDVTAVTELFYVNSAGTETQLTSGGGGARLVVLPDNTASAYVIREGASNPYLTISTTNAAESVVWGNATTPTTSPQHEFNVPAVKSNAFVIQSTSASRYFQLTTDNVTPASTMTYGSPSVDTYHLFEIPTAGGNGSFVIRGKGGAGRTYVTIDPSLNDLSFSTSSATTTITFYGTGTIFIGESTTGAPLAIHKLTTGTPSNTNNYGKIYTVDDAAANPQLYYVDDGGNVSQLTGTPDFFVTDNVALAFQVRQSTNVYLSVVTTNASEAVNVGVAATNPSVNVAGASGKLGFFGATAIVKPTVSGSRADPEQALADLLTELALLGLIVNSTAA